jgi:hypothetical protein
VKRSFRRLVDSPAYEIPRILRPLKDGRPPERSLTRNERLVVAVSACRPRYLVTLDSTLERPEFMREFAKLKQRLAVHRRPLVYFGTVAKGAGDGGYHGHFLIWTSLHYNTVHKHVRQLALGHAHVDPIDLDRPDEKLALRAVTYVLGQEEPVFASAEHRRHRPRPPSGRAFLHPQRKTLVRWHPDLLTALDLAKSPSVSDVELYRRCLR